MKTYLVLFVAMTAALAAAQQPAQPAALKYLTIPDIRKLPFSPPDQHLAYGSAPQQFGELRLPAGRGPFPVAVVIHGGCWEKKFADLHIMDPLATALTGAGVATWNIEYRAVDEPCGAWPGMFQDVGAATDFVRTLAPKYQLDLQRVIVIGHSAAGQLALWAAARSKVPKSSPVWTASPLPLRGAISLDGVDDLQWVVKRNGNICGDVVLDRLAGAGPQQAENLRAVSPAALLPLGVPEVLLFAARTMPWATADEHRTFAEEARQRGDHVEASAVENVGHFEFIAPNSIVWPQIQRAVLSLVK